MVLSLSSSTRVHITRQTKIKREHRKITGDNAYVVFNFELSNKMEEL